MVLLIFYLLCGMATTYAMTTVMEPRKDEELFEQAMGYCAIVAVGMALWWLFLPPLAAEIRKSRRKDKEAREIADLIYQRYREICYRVDVKPLEENWIDHYDIVLRLDGKENRP